MDGFFLWDGNMLEARKFRGVWHSCDGKRHKLWVLYGRKRKPICLGAYATRAERQLAQSILAEKIDRGGLCLR